MSTGRRAASDTALTMTLPGSYNRCATGQMGQEDCDAPARDDRTLDRGPYQTLLGHLQFYPVVLIAQDWVYCSCTRMYIGTVPDSACTSGGTLSTRWKDQLGGQMERFGPICVDYLFSPSVRAHRSLPRSKQCSYMVSSSPPTTLRSPDRSRSSAGSAADRTPQKVFEYSDFLAVVTFLPDRPSTKAYQQQQYYLDCSQIHLSPEFKTFWISSRILQQRVFALGSN